MSNNWNTPVDAQSYFRQQEKRLQRIERRTVPPVSDALGPGMAAQAIQIIDWNTEDALLNGFYYSQPGAIQNSPDSTLSWTGHVIAKDDGSGMQQVWNTDGPQTLYWIRTYAPTGDGNVTFTEWKKFASASGYVDDSVLHPDVVSNIQQALTDAADAIDYAIESNAAFRQPDAPVSTGNYTLRVNDTWFDTDDNNHIYVWDGTTWVDAADARIADALADAAAAQDAAQQAVNEAAAAMDYAETRNKTYRQTAKPTGGTYSLGDVWFDTDDGNHIYVYDGTDFVDAKDANIAAAQAAAAQAQTDAQNAVTTAANAQSTANSAATTASSAQTAANTAQTAANNAQTFAQTRNKVYRQTTMPTGGTYYVGDAWIDTSPSGGNRIYVYDGTTFTDARDTTIATAQAAATAAQTAATNAQTAANNAQTTANNAQTSANGKNTITWSAAAPTTQANTAGDTWFVTSGGLITQQWQGTGGTSWSQKTLDNAVIANLDAGKVVTGTLAAARIGAGTIDVTKLNVIMGGGNLLPDSGFEAATLGIWGTNGSAPTASSTTRAWTGTRSLAVGCSDPNADQYTEGSISVHPNTAYSVSAQVWIPAGWVPGNSPSNARSGGFVWLIDWNNSVNVVLAPADTSKLGQWQWVKGTITTGPTTTSISIRLYGAQTSIWFDEFQFEQGQLATAYSPKTDEILPGTIVTSMLQATAIDGMTVTGALLQTTAAASRGVKLTSTGLTAYNGSGAQTLNIDGSTGNVTITGALAAGSTIDGAVVTGGTVQTEATAARGIKINSTGLTAYNASGVATLTVTASTGAVSMLGTLTSGSTVTGATVTGGTIQTSANATTGIKIGTTGLTAYNASNTAVTTIDATTGVITTTGGVMTGGSVTGATLQTTATAARGIKIDSTQLIAYSDGTVSGGPAAGQATLQISAATGQVTTAGAILSSGSVTGATVTGGTLQSEPTTARGIKINSSGMTGYDSGGTPTFTLTSAGALTMTGPITTGGTITGATVQTSGAGAGAIRMTASALTAYDGGGTPSFTITAATGAVSMKGSLIAGSGVNGATVTGGTIQTEDNGPNPPRGIKMNSSGLTAYDSNSNPTFVLSAATGAVTAMTMTSGTITGNFQTATSGPRVTMGNSLNGGNDSIYFYAPSTTTMPGQIVPSNAGDGSGALSIKAPVNPPQTGANQAQVYLNSAAAGSSLVSLGADLIKLNGTASANSFSTLYSITVGAGYDLKTQYISANGGDGQVNFNDPIDMQAHGIANVGGSGIAVTGGGINITSGGLTVTGVFTANDHMKAGTRTQNISALGTRYTQSVTFGTAFPGAGPVPTVTCSPVVTGAEQVFATATSITRSGFTMTIVRTAGATGSVDINWMALAIP